MGQVRFLFLMSYLSQTDRIFVKITVHFIGLFIVESDFYQKITMNYFEKKSEVVMK